MDKNDRLKEIYAYIASSEVPVSGTELAKRFSVSRQVIVQDIALLRAQQFEIVSTNKGYVCLHKRCTREIQVKHDISSMELELNTIVDHGGRVEDVFVKHDVYGKLQASLKIGSRKDVQTLIEMIQSGASKPLTDLTSGIQSHTISACDEETLDRIESELYKLNFIYK